MTDYRTVLERDLDRVGPAPFGFDDVARRRDRKRRNQRIAAGVVGIAVFVAAVWIVTSVGSFDRTRTPAVPGPAETGPAETGPAAPASVATVTFDGSTCSMEITADRIDPGFVLFEVVNATEQLVSFDSWQLLEGSTFRAFEAAIERDRQLAEAPGHSGTLPSGGEVSYLSRDVIPANYSGLTLSRMSSGRHAIVCLQLREGRLHPFGIIGPIVVGTEPTETGPTETGPSVAPDLDAEGIIGLPPEGAMPSTPESGELVLQLEGITGGRFGMIWVYADGRMIWHRLFEDLPGSTGLVEQHLTPEGVEFLLSNALSTGLFAHDLDLVREDDAPFLAIGVRDGDRLVRVTWAWHGALRDPNAAEATPGQATALKSLDALITDPASWPASAWEDQEIREYVPATYAICPRVAPQSFDPARVLTLLPGGARNLLGSDFGLRGESEACANVTTEEARTLAGILDAAGIVRASLAPWEHWLRYLLADPQDAGNEVWISFQPVLPHGESTWLGPG